MKMTTMTTMTAIPQVGDVWAMDIPMGFWTVTSVIRVIGHHRSGRLQYVFVGVDDDRVYTDGSGWREWYKVTGLV
jgi:hypothetical protein